MCVSTWPLRQVARTGRVLERARFKSVTHSARESALEAAFGPSADRDEAVFSDTTHEWVVDPAFPEVPAEGLRYSDWTPCGWGKWKFPEGILTLEARALVMSMQRVACSFLGHDLRHLLLLIT